MEGKDGGRGGRVRKRKEEGGKEDMYDTDTIKSSHF